MVNLLCFIYLCYLVNLKNIDEGDFWYNFIFLIGNLEVTDTDVNLSACSRSKQPFAAGIVGKSARPLPH